MDRGIKMNFDDQIAEILIWINEERLNGLDAFYDMEKRLGSLLNVILTDIYGIGYKDATEYCLGVLESGK